MRRLLVLAAASAFLALPAAAAPRLSLRLGGDYLLDGGPGLFLLQLGVDAPLGRVVSVGGRFGGLVTTSPSTGGVPLDVYLRFRIGQAYLEGLGGPWIFFEGDTLRGHAAAGIGVVTRYFEVGGEIGYLSSSRTQLGVRIGFRI